MSAFGSKTEGGGERRSVWRVVAAALALPVLAAIGVALIFVFIGDERERAVQDWRTRMDIVAGGRAAAVQDWVDANYSELEGVAGNPSVTLFLSEYALAGGDQTQVVDFEAQVGYLRNYLVVVAERAGFAFARGPELPVNAPRQDTAGLAVLTTDAQQLVATPGMPALDDRLRAFVRDAPLGESAYLPAVLGPDGRPSVAFLAPIYQVQEDPRPEAQVGVVLGVRPLGADLYDRLRQPGAAEHSAEAYLARVDGDVVTYISPLANGADPLTLDIDIGENLAAARAARDPGRFMLARDYTGAEVLAVSRTIEGAPWTLVYKVDRAEALAQTDARLQRLIIIMLLALGMVALGLVAAWRHGTSRRASEAARRFRDMAERFERQGRFLRLVADSQPGGVMIVDGDGRCRFANKAAAAPAGLSVDEVDGTALAVFVGAGSAKRYLALNRAALESGETQYETRRDHGPGGPEAPVRVINSAHIPLGDMTPEIQNAVLIVETDVSELVRARERHERVVRQVVDALVSVVDVRDPHAARHSVRVAALAAEIAREMGLDATAIETVSYAGTLLNLGKIAVSEQVLTSPDTLSADDRDAVRKSILTSASLLEGIEFDGPVVEIIRQAQEHVDGGGLPLGLAGDEILLGARIVAVANAFVAMTSPRAHRTGLDIDKAVDVIMNARGKIYDRAVAAALAYYLDNRGGRAAMSAMGEDAAA